MTIPGGFLPGDALAAVELNALGGLIAGGGYAIVTANQASITTVADLTGLSVTFTAQADRLYRLSAFGWFISTVNGDTVRFTITDSANNVLMIAQATLTTSSNTSPTVTGFALRTFSAGSTTVKCRAERQTGTGSLTLLAGATFPACLIVEDMGVAV